MFRSQCVPMLLASVAKRISSSSPSQGAVRRNSTFRSTSGGSAGQSQRHVWTPNRWKTMA